MLSVTAHFVHTSIQNDSSQKKNRHKTQNRMENEFSRWFTTLRRVKKTWHIYELMQQSAGIISFHFIFVSACRHQNEHTFIAPIVLRRRIEQTLVMLCAPCVQCTHPWKSKFHSTFSSSGVSTVAFWIAYQPSSQLVWATVSACVTESRFAMYYTCWMYWKIEPSKWINYCHCLIWLAQSRWLYWHAKKQKWYKDI